ncbi:MAG: Na/Pi cotransporter family protein [Deltaproteobacteria bacterium]|nr:Na/Pi cotransporter family protein [Deltaproteobacteria bacterium]
MFQFQHFSWLWFFGSLALFFYGIRLSRSGLQLWFGDRLKPLITTFTKTRWKAFFAGIFITIVFQSSSATAITLISFAGAGLVTVTQAMGVLLGADIGTTVVVILLSIQHISEMGLVILIVGVAIYLYSKSKKAHNFATILMGFGFIFFGLKLLGGVGASLGNTHDLMQIFVFLQRIPLLAFILSLVMTPFLSSAGTLGIALGLSFSGLIGLNEAFPVILGANVGSAITPLFSSFSERQEGRRVALAHFIFKAIGALALLPFYQNIVAAIIGLSGLMGVYFQMPSHQIALAHLLFNLALSIFFLPFIALGAKLVRWLLPDKGWEEESKYGPKYLNPDHLQNPLLAFANARREILRLCDLTYEIFRDCIQAFHRFDPDLISGLESKEDLANVIDRELRIYLTNVSADQLTQEQAGESIKLINTSNALEEIGDTVIQNILDLSGKKLNLGKNFSEEGWQELMDYHTQILQLFEMAISVLTLPNEELSRKIIHKAKHLRVYEDELREKHLERVKCRIEETVSTSALHLDALSSMKRVVKNIEKVVQIQL